ncbi:hypothetical protein niasHS_006517 [Heterodera schachtii]|uniref:Uncharacterized protein n=1 Tax=Heterodera schachtii TaxID=97005 RepID=A0ABD2JHG5_HETSC
MLHNQQSFFMGFCADNIRKKSFVHQQRPLYFTAAAEPLIIVEAPSPVRKVSKRRKSDKSKGTEEEAEEEYYSNQMTVIGDLSTQKQLKNAVGNGAAEFTQRRKKGKYSPNSTECEGAARQPQKEEGILQSLRSYPTGVFFMLGNEFCERFSFYGMRAILIIYLVVDHKLSDNVAKVVYHSFVSLAYFSPLFGSILADNFFGRFRVILWVSLVYVFGHVLLSVGAIPVLDSLVRKTLDYSGLAVIALATGGIKPCVSAFAADQFGDDQQRQRTQFFSFFYFAINAGSLLAMGITPRLRTVQCLGADHCFPLAFAIPGLLMLVAFLTFLFGWRNYKITPANKGNILWKVVRCIFFALRRKMRNTCWGSKSRSHRRSPDHWLDYARPKYDEHLIAGVKSMLAIIVLYIPIVFFWALYDQQGSTWVLQARRMDGRIGWFTLLPDQVNTLNPLLVLILVPLFEAWLYPTTNKMCKVTPLRKMAIGTILAAVAFCMAGFLQIKVNDTMEPQPESGYVFLQRLGNHSGQFSANNSDFILPAKLPDELKQKVHIGAENYTFSLLGGTNETPQEDNDNFNFSLNLGTKVPKSRVVGLFLLEDKSSVGVQFPYSTEKTDVGKTRFYFLLLPNSPLNGAKCYALDDQGKAVASSTMANGAFVDIQPGFFSTSQFYHIAFGDCAGGDERPKCAERIEVHARMGAAYVVDLVSSNNSEPVELVRPNSVNILWQMPQVFVMTVGEILLSVTGLEFSYSQAAPSMKSVVQALWLLTVFFGNIIDIVISQVQISDPVEEFFIYAALMFAVIGLFVLLAMRYKYVDEHNLEIPDSPERSRRSSDEYSSSSSDRRSDDDRLELGRGAVAGLPPPALIEKADR